MCFFRIQDIAFLFIEVEVLLQILCEVKMILLNLFPLPFIYPYNSASEFQTHYNCPSVTFYVYFLMCPPFFTSNIKYMSEGSVH